MNKATALWTISVLVSLSCAATAGERPTRLGRVAVLGPVAPTQAPPQAASGPRWKSRKEYDAYNAMVTETDPEKKIALADSFLQDFPSSDFKAGAYLAKMRVYYSQGKSDRAIEAAEKVVLVDPDNLEALAFLSHVYPFTFKDTVPDKTAVLSRTEIAARRGLIVLRRFSKPANVTDEQFRAYIISKRAIFYGALGFVALQRKDYVDCIAVLKAAVADNPTDILDFYRMGLAYLYSTPPDYSHGLWYVARAAGLARASRDPSTKDILGYLRRLFVKVVGNDAALENTISQALISPNPPEASDNVVRPRPRIPPGSGPSTGTGQGPSGQLSTAQSKPGTTYRIFVAIYPTWLPPPADEGENPVSLPSPVQLNERIAEQPPVLPEGIDLRGPEPPWQDAGAAMPPEPPAEPEPAPPMIVLVYKDGHRVEVQNYAIVGKNLVWFSGQLSKKIPLADLDLPATRKVNEDQGVTFVAPDEP